MQYHFEFNGREFDTLDEFFELSIKLFTRDLSWKPGKGYNAFNDLLRGGFGVFDEDFDHIIIEWTNFDESRKKLGDEEVLNLIEIISNSEHNCRLIIK